MPVFEYKGVDGGGKNIKGIVEADSSKTARQKLKTKGIFPTNLTEKNKADKASSKQMRLPAAGRVKMKNLTLMIRQMATMIKARIPLDETLSGLVEQTDDPALKTIIAQIRNSVNEGKSLAESCKPFPKVFTPIFVAMIRVGEASGNLDLVLKRLADFSENQLALRNKVLGALSYPAFICIAGIGITIFLFAFAVPQITEVFAGSKVPLPTITVVMIAISGFVTGQWPLLIVSVVGTIFFFSWYTNTKNGREWWDRTSLKIPIYGKLKRMIAVSRFARTLSTLVGSGVQILDAIDIVKDVVDNSVIRNALIQSRDSIAEGKTIAGPLKASGQFPPILTHMIAVGEKTGELEEMLVVVSDTYDTQVDTAIDSMTRLLEPLMIAGMGIIIALVAISIFLPMMEMNNLTNVSG